MTSSAGEPLARRLGIGPRCRVGLLNAPEGFLESLGPLPEGVRVESGVRVRRDVVLAFVHLRTELDQKLAAMRRAVEPDGVIWVLWPRRSPTGRADVTEDVVRAVGERAGLSPGGAVPVDGTWTALRLVPLADPRC